MKRFIIIIVISMIISCSLLTWAEDISSIKSFTIDEAIDYALKFNYETLVKEEELKIAKEGIREAKAQILPHLSARGIYTEYKDHPYLTYENNLDASATVTQTVFSGGKIFNTIKQQQYNLKATEENKRRIKQLVIYSVTEAFYQVLLNNEILNIEKETLALAEAHFSTTRARYNAGEVSQYDVLRAEVEVAKIKPELIKAENNLYIAKNQFKLILGMDLSDEVELIGEFKYLPEENNKEELLEKAKTLRPEIEEMAALKEAAQAAVKAVRAGYLPTVSLNCTDYFSEKAAFSSGREKYDDYWVSYIALDMPIFDGFLTKAKVGQSRAQLEEIKIREKELMEGIKLDVENAYYSFKAAQETVESQVKNVERAKKGYEIMQTRYKYGKATQLDLLDAQLSLSTAKLNYVQSLYDHFMSKAALTKAIGEE